MKRWFLIFALALTACSASSAQLVAAPQVPTPTGWTEITPQPMRIDGRLLTPTCSDAPGADPAFRFWTRQGTSDRLVIYFEGGGACWDDLTCSIPRFADSRGEGDGFFKAELIPSDAPERMSGIFDLANARNPLRDWSFVYVPYCTGDVHTGANTARYRNADTGAPFQIEHRGADNFRVVLEWIKANFDTPEQILVAGSSAGAYGAQAHYVRIRNTFPRSRAALLGDAGQGVATQDFVDARNSAWHYQLPHSVFGAAPLTADDDVVARLAEHYPRDRFAQYTTAHDITQSAFYALMGVENACSAWSLKMRHDLSGRQAAPNFRSYVAAGQTHTILRSRLFYTEASGGAPFAEWLAALVGDSGESWQNRACTNCEAPPARCGF